MPMMMRGAPLALAGLCALAAAAPALASGLVPPERLTLKNVDYVLEPASQRSGHGPWRYVSEDGQESGPWTTEIVLSYQRGTVSTPQAQAALLRAGKGQEAPPGRLLDVQADPQHAYWAYLDEPAAGEQSHYLSGGGKSFHLARCQGVVRYEFRSHHPMAWVPDERQRAQLRQAFETEGQRIIEALRRNDWRPVCE
ncbi:MAG: hypothetical protein QM569_02110 [Acidovorax sp.]|uniref:hypothetical protein n=1 Tax=Acidovorax sp. TaxID=1872122 RepID=UPI0039E68DC2